MKKHIFISILWCCLSNFSIGQSVMIINGTAVPVGNYEWMVGLSNSLSTSQQFCGATLVTPRWVVTAAHCLVGETPSSVKTFFKVYVLSHPVTGYFFSSVDSIYIHPLYDASSSDNDIALIKLSSNVTSIVPVNLPLQGDTTLITVGRNQQTMGWGTTQSLPGGADTLMEVTVPIVSSIICDGTNSYAGSITTNMICAGFLAGGKDACYGDSGGPLVTNENGQWYQTGIVSWGYGCAQQNYPGVYTKVANYINWINQHTNSTSTINEYANNKLIFQKDDESIVIKGFKTEETVKSVEFYTTNGQLIATTNQVFKNAQAISFSTSSLAEGIYIVKALTDKYIYTGKFLK